VAYLRRIVSCPDVHLLRYINRRNIPICEAFFPNMKLVTLDTGHWVQAEKPNEFVQEVEKWLKEN
jgi:pimeloyl-ACP methyl ester carboxylesterase